MDKAVAYVRVSTDEQANHGISLEAQESAVRLYCGMRGLDLVAIFVDAGVSAGKGLGTRPGGQQLLDALKRGEVRAVIAFKLDRLFRNAQNCLEVTDGWDKAGVALHLLDMGGQSIDTGTAMGRFFLTIMAGCAELERGMIRERTTAVMRHKAAKGERVGRIPFGKALAVDRVHLEDDPQEQAIIRQIVFLRRTEGLTLQQIVARLDKDGVKPAGMRWHETTIRRILKKAA